MQQPERPDHPPRSGAAEVPAPPQAPASQVPPRPSTPPTGAIPVVQLEKTAGTAAAKPAPAPAPAEAAAPTTTQPPASGSEKPGPEAKDAGKDATPRRVNPAVEVRQAVAQVPGVVAVGEPVSRALERLREAMGQGSGAGVEITEGQAEAAVDLGFVASPTRPLRETAAHVQSVVRDVLARGGFAASEVNIEVLDVAAAPDPDPAKASPESPAAPPITGSVPGHVRIGSKALRSTAQQLASTLLAVPASAVAVTLRDEAGKLALQLNAALPAPPLQAGAERPAAPSLRGRAVALRVPLRQQFEHITGASLGRVDLRVTGVAQPPQAAATEPETPGEGVPVVGAPVAGVTSGGAGAGAPGDAPADAPDDAAQGQGASLASAGLASASLKEPETEQGGASSRQRSRASLLRRELHPTRAGLSITVAILLAVVLGYVALEAGNRAVDHRPWIVAPETAWAWFRDLPGSAHFPAGVIVLGIIGICVGVGLLCAALIPGRRRRHALTTERVLGIVEDDVLAQALVRPAHLAAGVGADQVRVFVDHRRVAVTVRPTSGVAVDAAAVEASVRREVERQGFGDSFAVSVTVAERGVVGQ